MLYQIVWQRALFAIYGINVQAVTMIVAISMSLRHKAPHDVLMIGPSWGSWAQVIASHPQVRKLPVVEINPAYLDLIARYPIVASVLHNPNVEIDIDDGRRWLIRNQEPKFDAIIMNTA